MKNKYLLFALPALLALSACACFASAKPQQKGNFFREDTLAHNEIFDGEEKAVGLRDKQPLRTMTPGEGSLLTPKIGVQWRDPYDNNTKIAVRFVAAVAALDVNAEWTRAAYDASGSIHGSSSTVTVTKAYATLNNGLSTTTASTEFPGYNYYVVYTIRDIPVSTYNDYYIVATLKISDPSNPGTAEYSKTMAARIGGNVTASFPRNTTGYFLAGKIGGDEGSVLASENDVPDGNVARFSSALAQNDAFYVCYNNPTLSKFKVYNSSAIKETNPFLVDDGQDSHRIKVNSAHNYAFNFSNSFKLWDIESGYAVSYIKQDESAGSARLVFDGYDNSSVPQHKASISPKTGSALTFTLDGNAITPTKESGENNNINESRVITKGGAFIDIYLKDNVGNTLWVTQPDLQVSVNGNVVVASKRTHLHGNLAIFEVPLETGQHVIVSRGYDEQLKLGDTQNVEYTATATATHAIYINGESKVYYDELATVTFNVTYNTYGRGLYAVGTFSGNWEPWEEYRLTYNDGNIWTGSFLLPVGKTLQLKEVHDDNLAWTENTESNYRTITSGSMSVTGWNVF